MAPFNADCFNKHAWVVGLCAGMVGLIFVILLSLASGWRDADAAMDVRLRNTEQVGATLIVKQDATLKTLDEIKADVKELRKQNDRAKP